MSNDVRLERVLSDVLDAATPMRAPAGLRDDLTTVTGRMRPRPRWLVFIKEPPMRISSRVAVGSPTARLATVLFATLVLAVAATGAVVAGATLLAGPGMIIVDQNDPKSYQTVNEAVAVAEDGDTVLVKPGTYRESITITKDIVLRGDGPREEVVLEFDADGPTSEFLCEFSGPYGLMLEESGADVSGLTLRDASGTVHLLVVNGGAPLIHDIVADHAPAGDLAGTSACFDRGSAGVIRDSALAIVFVTQGSPATIEGNTISGWTIINPSGTRGSADRPTIVRGNHVQGVTFNGPVRVEDNVFELEAGEVDESANDTDDEWVWGVNVHGGQGWIVRDNTIDGFAIGIDVSLGADGTVTGNDISNTATGIRLRSGSLIERNTIRGGSDGIRAESLGSATITGNSVEDAARGIAVAGRATPTLAGNVLCGNAVNLFVAQDAEPVVEADNEICPDGLATARE